MLQGFGLHFVSRPAPPYTNWNTAANSIQHAVDAAAAGDLILVTNGVYRTGGRAVNGYSLTNRVALTQPVTLQSLNGPQVTVIQGYQVAGTTNGDAAVRCAYLTNGAVLSGFTLTKGATRTDGDWGFEQGGGGVCCESSSAVVTNCTLSGNSAGSAGGGAYGGTFVNCVIRGNSAGENGGGAYGSTLTNCTVSENSAVGTYLFSIFVSFGGGASWSTLNNCNLAGNWAILGGGAGSCILTNCTLTGNSATGGWPQSTGGGANGGTLCNCTLAGNWTDEFGSGGGAAGATLYNCLLTNNSGYYGAGAYGGTLYNCTLTGNSAEECGGGADGCTLTNSTLTANFAGLAGGGVRNSTLNKCTLTGNSAVGGGGGAFDGSTLNGCTLTDNSGGEGGGAEVSTLNNCTLSGNSATRYDGGAAYQSTLNNCTLAGNSAAGYGGGSSDSTLNNCIVYDNTATAGSNHYRSALNCCSTQPLPADGAGNITNAPLFVDYAGGNLRLQSNSPCINAGYNAYVIGATDLDGNPRIKGGTVDMGAYEFQNPASVISYAWLQYYGLPTDGSADHLDSDGDGMSNWQEWIAGTDPDNAASALRLQPPSVTPPGVLLRWSSITNRTYVLERCTNPLAPGTFYPIQSNIPGLPGTTSFTDTNAPAVRPTYYRIRVQP